MSDHDSCMDQEFEEEVPLDCKFTSSCSSALTCSRQSNLRFSKFSKFELIHEQGDPHVQMATTQKAS